MLKALYVEDNEADAELACWALSRATPPIQLDVVATIAKAIEYLSCDAHSYRWVLFDLALPDGNGMQVLHYVREHDLPLATVAVTGTGDEQSVVRALKLGVDDYVIKQADYLDYLADSLHGILSRPRFECRRRPLRVLFAARDAQVSPVPAGLADSPLEIETDTVSDFARVVERLEQVGHDVLVIAIDDGPLAIDALETIRRIRSKNELQVPIVAIAAHSSELIASQALRLGVSDYLIKDESYLQRLPLVIESVSSKAQLQELSVQRERLRVTQEAMEVASLNKNRFIADMSHEIRTPLNGLLGLLFLMQKSSPSEEQQNLLDMAEQSGQYLLQVLNDILDLSKLEVGRIQLELRDFRLDDLLKRVRAILLAQAKSKGLQFRVDLAAEVPMLLHGDSLRLQQVLLNLASNAIKFTDKGGVAICVCSKPGRDGRAHLTFSVRDSGIGLTPKQQKSIFAPFSQADASISRRYGGTGLGLALAKELVSLMGGTITVNSEVGVGSEFVFDLALEHARKSQVERAVSLSNDPEDEGGLAIHGASVLLVDDNHINQLVTRAYLRHLQVETDVCDDGEEAVEAVRAHGADYYDLILLDLHMPGMDGFEVAQAIRALPGGEGVPIIALTASVSGQDQKRCKQVGMNDVLVKPIGLSSLSAALAHWLPAGATAGNR